MYVMHAEYSAATSALGRPEIRGHTTITHFLTYSPEKCFQTCLRNWCSMSILIPL